MSSYFAVKKPCKNCPFRKSSKKGWLGSERMRGIVQDLSDKFFPCHKTVDYSSPNSGKIIRPLVKGESFCAGAVIFLKRTGLGGHCRPLVTGRALRLYDPDTFPDQHDDIFSDVNSLIEHHDYKNL